MLFESEPLSRFETRSKLRADRRVVALADAVRTGRGPRADLVGIAAALDITVRHRQLPRPLEGLTAGEVVDVDSRLDQNRRRFVTAHEFAHVLVRRGRCNWVARSDEEAFADQFASELLLPAQALLSDSREPAALSHDYGLPIDAVWVQLCAAGRVPQLLRLGTMVVCGTCGTRYSRQACKCRRFRQRAGLKLPTFVPSGGSVAGARPRDADGEQRPR